MDGVPYCQVSLPCVTGACSHNLCHKSQHQHLLHLTAASWSTKHTRVSDTSNGWCTNSPVDLLSASTGCLPILTPLTAAALHPSIASTAPLGPIPPLQKRAATAALCAWCSRKLLMCAGGRLLQCRRGASSSTLARRAISSCCWLGSPGPATMLLQPVALAHPVDKRPSAFNACRQHVDTKSR
jgi:hypothetical protein